MFCSHSWAPLCLFHCCQISPQSKSYWLCLLQELSDQLWTFFDINILPLAMTNSNTHIVKVTLDCSSPWGHSHQEKSEGNSDLQDQEEQVKGRTQGKGYLFHCVRTVKWISCFKKWRELMSPRSSGVLWTGRPSAHTSGLAARPGCAARALHRYQLKQHPHASPHTGVSWADQAQHFSSDSHYYQASAGTAEQNRDFPFLQYFLHSMGDVSILNNIHSQAEQGGRMVSSKGI